MLNTNLQHLESDEAFSKALEDNENVAVVCGREGPMCLPVYDVMENLESRYPHVAFRDMSFDGPAAHNIKALPEVRSFTGLPFTVYFKHGKVVEATSSIQKKGEVRTILDGQFGSPSSRAA